MSFVAVDDGLAWKTEDAGVLRARFLDREGLDVAADVVVADGALGGAPYP